MRTTTNRWIITGIALALSCPAISASAARFEFVGEATAIVGRLTPVDEARFARLAESQGPGRVAFIYLASDGGDLSAAAMIARQIRAERMTTVVDAARFPCLDASVTIFVSGARRLYLHAPTSGGSASPGEFRGLGFAVHGGAAGDLAAAMTEFGATKSAALIDNS